MKLTSSIQSIFAIAAVASLIPIGPLLAQTDGKPGEDSTPADLREPIQPTPTPATPTVPAEGAAVPEEVDLDPDVVQATDVEDTDATLEHKRLSKYLRVPKTSPR